MRSVIVVALLASTACKQEPDAPVGTPAPPTDGIEMVKLGNVPHQLLRYHLIKGTTSAIEIVMDYELSANERVLKMPTLVLGSEVTVDDVQPDGTASMRTRIVKAEIRDTPAAVTPGVAADKAKQLVGIT